MVQVRRVEDTTEINYMVDDEENEVCHDCLKEVKKPSRTYYPCRILDVDEDLFLK